MSDKNLDELVDLYLEDDLEEISTTAGVPGYQTPMAFTGGLPKYEKRRKKTAMSGGYKLAKKKKKPVYYGPSFKKDDTKNSRQKVNGAIKEINKRLFEIDRIISRASKLKKEDGVGRDSYWKSTGPRMTKIAERLIKVSQTVSYLFL